MLMKRQIKKSSCIISQGWAIKGVHGLYQGWWQLKRDAINTHCAEVGKNWLQCRAKGDCCVRVSITEVTSKGLMHSNVDTNIPDVRR